LSSNNSQISIDEINCKNISFFGDISFDCGGGGVFFFFFFFIFTSLPSLESSTEQLEISEIDKWLELLSSKEKFNGAVLISENGAPLLLKAYGYTDSKFEEKLNIRSSFRLASISKQFTAACILILVHQQKLELDDFVGNYIIDFPYKNITIRNLLNHTSGIPDSYIDLAHNYKSEVEPELTITEAIDLIKTNSIEPIYSSNDKFKYSNTNYILLAGIIESLSKQPLEKFMFENLFEPLGMNNCRVWNLLSKDPTFPGKTSSFIDFGIGRKELKPSFIDGVAGDGGVFCSIEDFLIWDKFWYENKLIPPKVLEQAFIKPMLNNGEFSNYGFGWFVDENIVYHSGTWLGSRTYIRRNTKSKRCLVILDNSRNPRINKIIKTLKTTTDN